MRRVAAGYLPGVTADPRILRAGEGDRGRRLDLFLAQNLDVSRAAARRLLARGAVCVDGRTVGVGAKGMSLAPEAVVEVAPFARPEQQRAVAETRAPLEVLSSGPGWVAVDKPAGVPVHPLREGESGTLLGALLARHPELHGVGEGGLRSGVVHRLDVDTSGVVLFATTEAAWQRLRGAFRERRIEKVYRALVVGRLERDGEVELPLVTARHRPARVRVVGEHEHPRSARLCALSWRPLELLGPATLLEVRPRSGFLHQIRVTLAHLGFPIVGDRVYGAGADTFGAPRQMLHAARVCFEEVEAASADPEDFSDLCRRLRG
jgi:23S rRNA pseudouridine1911/1915/1917 synthase